MTVKPIVVVYLPEDIYDNGRNLTMKECIEFASWHEREKPDYHWFFLPDSHIERIEFKVFYEKDFTEIQYQELKTIIEESIKK